jgi:hypothetical protein
VFGALGLCRGKCAEGCEHGVVNGPGIEEKGANHFLEALRARFVQGSGGVFWFSILNTGAVVGNGPGVGRVLWLGGYRVGEALERLFDISGHGEGHVAIVIIPVEGDATELVRCHVGGDFVVLA